MTVVVEVEVEVAVEVAAPHLPQVLGGVGEAGDEPPQLLVDGRVELDVVDVRVEAEGDALRDGGPVLRLLLGVAEEARRREHLQEGDGGGVVMGEV